MSVALEQALNCLQIVVGRIERQFRQRLRNPWRSRDAQSCQPGTRLGEKAVAMSVVTALKLNDEISAGRRPRQTNRAHGCLGARTYKTHALHRG